MSSFGRIRRIRGSRLIAVGAMLALVASGVNASQRPAGPAGQSHDPALAAVTSCGTSAQAAGAGTAGTAAAAKDAGGLTGGLAGLPDFQTIVRPQDAQTRTIAYDGARLDIKPGSVRLPVGVGITPLKAQNLPRLDPGMTNVTAGPRSGWRFTPHPMSFTQNLTVTLPYDPALLDEDVTAQDVYTFYYDDAAACWQPLERVSVDEVNHLVTSLTDHFTDMINATVAVPEHPEGTSFNPNQIKDIQAADPGTGVNLIGAPAPNNQGDNRLSYPIEVPKGREGLAPQLSVRYNSSGPNGWMGQGWDLPLQAIVTDARWGVPRYDAAMETETYLLNGEELTPVANRGALQARTAEKVFHTRVEGQFQRIVRHGSGPSGYTWEITDKSGTHWFYGAQRGASGPEAAATLADGADNVNIWALREVRDANGNLMRYHYATVDDTGLAGGSEPGRNLYLQRITYTGLGDTEGRYAVTFTRDRELNEPLRVDKIIDARGGFKRVTADLLRRVEVTLDGSLIRRYEFGYAAGAFFKTLLHTIKQFDANGALFNTHTLDYFDDIRDAQGAYQAFEQVGWTSPSDGLSSDALNLTPEQAGDASALQSNTSVGGGGHLYVGVGTSPTKNNSVGVKVGFNHSEDEGLLALIDVDGDSLPDKVFDDGGVKYRKNLSGPNGQLRFSTEVRSLNLPGILGENNNTLTLGIEGYTSGIAAQLDYVNTFATTDQYFSDVNGDGITDLVTGSSVLFGRVGSNGTPVYGVSGDTPVPVGAGTVNSGGLFGDFAGDRERLDASFPLLDTVRRWVAPFAGTVKVEGAFKLADETAAARAESTKADGVRVAIQREDTELFATTVGAHDNSAHTPSGVGSIAVSKGDRLYFRVGSNADGGLDLVSWNPQVTYLNVAATPDVNGLDAHRYQASRDFTLGGRTTTVKVPLTGTMHLDGDLQKTGTTTDDVTAVITRDGTVVFQQTLAGGATGSIPISLDIPVTQGQTLKWRIRVDSPVDVDKLEWTPRGFYTGTPPPGVDRLTDDQGNPLVVVNPPYDLDIYPVDGLTAPQGFQHISADATLSVEPQLAFNFGGQQPTARVAFTVKRRGELLAKRFFDINAGVVTAPAAFSVDVADGDDLFYDFSTTDPALRAFLTSQSVLVDGATRPSVFHSADVEGAFAQPYRGWAAIGYNGNGDRATQPIVQNDLVVDENFGDQLPDTADPQGQQGQDFANDPRVDPPKVAPFSPSPLSRRWGAGEKSFVTRDQASSSRLGVDSIALPTPGDFGGGTAVPRLSRSEQVSLTGSVGGGVGTIGGSIATGESTGQVDFVDMNGDQFPDVVGAGGIQYTDPTGGLGATTGLMPDGAVRQSSNVSGNASAGSAARTIATGRGYASPPGTAAANNAQSGNDMPPLGVGGSLGASTSQSDFDLLDINGDDLPDRVYSDGTVRLNLGYSFGAAEPWRNPAALNDGSGVNFGVNIGFNTDFYGFAGGASYSEGSGSTASTLMDMNGDGLLDRVFAGTPLRVALNTGNGFEPAVPFNGSLSADSDLNGDQNAKLGGGVYFTFGICFTAVCIVINPGGDVSTGASRTEMSLRDINGDGFADHLTSEHDDQLTVAENKTGRTNLLRSVQRPLGGRLDFDYTRDGNTYDQPQSRWVLTRVAVNDGQPGDGQDVQLVTYEYAGGVFDRLEREFYGYGTFTERHRDPAAAGEATYRSVIHEFRTDSHYTRGLQTRELTVDAAGHPFTETQSTYALRDLADPGGAADAKSTTATIFPQLTRTDQRFFEGQPVAAKSTATIMEYDAFGNMTRSLDAGEPGPADDVDTRIGYSATSAACQASYIVGTPNVLDVTGGGAAMRHRESTVDCTTGDVTQIRARLQNGATAVTDLEYNPDGNLKAVVNPPNEDGQRYRLDYVYDPTVGIYIVSTTDSFGLRSTAGYNLKFGLVETTTDFNNQVVRNTYDAVGRTDTVVGPYEAPENRTTIDFEYHPEAPVPYAVSRHLDRQADGTVRTDTIDTITFVDGLKRPIQTKKDATVFTGQNTPATDVMVVSGRLRYDFLGRPAEQFYPVTEPKGAANTTFNAAFDPVAPTRSAFDVLDRTTRTTLPDGTFSTLSYGFGPDRAGATQFEMVSTDANGKVKRTYSDVREQTTSIKEFNPAGGQPVIWTSYGYDPLGQVTSVVDDHNNVTSASYDNLGRRTIVDSPDSGRTETVYDLADNPIRKITAKLAAENKQVVYDYDFNRIAAIRYPIFTANNVTYTYGAPGAPNGGAGRIIGMVDGAGTVSREYGPLGELTKETRTTPAQGSHISTFTTRWRYDTWNRTLAITYPDGEVLSYRYNSGGQVNGATGVKGSFTYQYLTRLEYDKFEQRALLDTGNGTRTQYTYNAADRRLSNMQARIAQGYVFHNLNYTYDNVGNVTRIVNNTQPPSGPAVGMQVGGPSTQTFAYDDLYRLTHAEGSYQSRNPKLDRYRVDVAYDSVHNTTSKNQLHELVSGGNAIVQGKTTYNYAYAYNGAQPHAPSTLGIFTLQYDANGNQISRDQQPRPRRQMIWDEDNRLACSHENVQSHTLPQTPESCDNAGGTPNEARYFYDDQGNRVVKDGAQFHMYPNRNYSTNGNKEYKHVYIGETKLLTKFVEPAQRIEDVQFYSHGDHLSSTGFTTDTDGGLAEHLQYFPFGETWVSEHPSQPVPQQFTGKELDPETNLYYYGARYYDPRTQLWQTPDPVIDTYLDGAPNAGVFHPANLAAYTYAANNPVKLTDPDGKWVNVAIGAGIGLLVGVGVEGIRQAVKGEFDGGRLAGAAAAGVVSGAVAGATMGTSLIVQGGAAVGGGVAGGVVSRAITGEEQTVEAVTTDAIVSGVTFGVVKGGGAAIRSLRGAPPPAAAPPPTTPAVRPATAQPQGGAGVVLRDAQGATAAEVAASTGGPTGGSRAGQAAVRQTLVDEADQAGGVYRCWRCGQTSTNASNMHLGHRNVPTSRGGNLSRPNVCLEGAACNLSAGNRGGPRPGMSCAERGSCGAPYGRTD